ncbi:MAG: 6-hydroxymethylpterin diphosphokinase MptE-like protein, partial [Nitrospirota bacterium]|nr:6-hydroxymethylpterin diphosphokinase MptE-like protein [Nitrospirota bacterium]
MTVFERNLEFLRQRHPELVNLVQESPSTTHLTIESARNGDPRLRVQTASGTIVDLHDPEDPAQVARGTIEQMGVNIGGVTVSLGIELGYFARTFVSKLKSQSRLIVYEADPAIFLMALRTVDLSEVLRCRWVKIVVGPQAPLRHWATQCVSQTNGTLRVVSYDPVFQLAPEIYGERVERELDRIPGIVKATKNAVIRRGPLFIDSLLKNIPHIMMAEASTELKGCCRGIPAFLVSAGPSLEKNFHHLKAAKGRAVIIAADTALNYLLPRGIVPDVVVSVDPQKETYRKFKHLDIPGEVALVFHPSVSPLIVKYFPGPTFAMDTAMPVYQWLNGFWPDKGAIDVEAMCQAHVAFNLADCMGCDPIVFVGQDLSYTDERMHVKHGGYLTESEQAAIVADGLLTRDIFGKPIKTNPTFVNYKAVFERKIKQFSGTVIQATEGGLALEGAETCLLADVLQEYCQGAPIELYQRFTERHMRLEVKEIEAVQAEVQTQARNFFRVERTSQHVCRLLEAMKRRWQQHRQVDQEFTRLGKQVERLTSCIPRYQQVRELLHWMDLELEIQLDQDTQELEETTDLTLKHEKQLERGLKYYGGLIRIAPKLRNYCERLAYRLGQWSVL